MISADFYPSVITNPVTGLEVTDVISNLQISEPSDAYWLGWIKPENIPDSFLPSNWALSNSALTFSVIGKEVNHNFGYISMYTTNATKASTIQLFPTDPVTVYNAPRYINKFDVMGGGNLGNLYCNLGVFLEYGESADNITNSFLRTTSTASPFNVDAYDFFDDTETIDISVQITGSTYYTKSIKYSDFNEDGYVVDESTFTESDVNYFLRTTIFILGYRFGFLRDITETSQTGAYTNALPSIDIMADDKRFVTGLAGWGTTVQAQRVSKTGAFTNAVWTNGFYGNYGFINFGVNADIPLSAIARNPVSTFVPHSIYGNVFVCNVSRNYTELYRFYTPNEIYKNFCLLIRITRGSTVYGYNDGQNYATYVTETNEFTATIITGDLSNSAFKLKLRPWQYDIDEWSENGYTVDDLPPYDGGGDDGTDSGGDDIRTPDLTNARIGAANNFVTLYGMTAATVADFGKKMWASLSDAAFWQMVGTTFTNDFSINPADMMKYFISLRYFPFDVSDFAHSTATGVYIGRAATPIAPSVGVQYPIRVTNNVVQVDGGRLTISRYYHDFRDFEPCTTVQIHVPFCGSVDVPASEVMGHEMDLTYKIDLQTGAMLAVLGVASNTYYVIATLAGTCGATIPITANNNIEFLQRIATVGSGLIGGGVSGAVKGATVGGEVGAVVGAVAGTVGGGVGALAGLPPVTVHKQGNASGFANLGGVPYAYATVQRGRFERPANYGHTTGFACDFSATLGSLSGFTVCDNVDTSGLTCNADERDEIKRLLESGVYV